MLRKGDDRIPVYPRAKTKTKLRYESRKMVLKLELGSKLDCKMVRGLLAKSVT